MTPLATKLGQRSCGNLKHVYGGYLPIPSRRCDRKQRPLSSHSQIGDQQVLHWVARQYTTARREDTADESLADWSMWQLSKCELIAVIVGTLSGCLEVSYSSTPPHAPGAATGRRSIELRKHTGVPFRTIEKKPGVQKSIDRVPPPPNRWGSDENIGLMRGNWTCACASRACRSASVKLRFWALPLTMVSYA